MSRSEEALRISLRGVAHSALRSMILEKSSGAIGNRTDDSLAQDVQNLKRATSSGVPSRHAPAPRQRAVATTTQDHSDSDLGAANSIDTFELTLERLWLENRTPQHVRAAISEHLARLKELQRRRQQPAYPGSSSRPSASEEAEERSMHTFFLREHVLLMENERRLMEAVRQAASTRARYIVEIKACCVRYRTLAMQHVLLHKQRQSGLLSAPTAVLAASSIANTCLSEVHRLLDAYREATVDVVEKVLEWQRFVRYNNFFGCFSRLGSSETWETFSAAVVAQFLRMNTLHAAFLTRRNETFPALDSINKDDGRSSGSSAAKSAPLLVTMCRDLHQHVFSQEPLLVVLGTSMDWNPLALPGAKWSLLGSGATTTEVAPRKQHQTSSLHPLQPHSQAPKSLPRSATVNLGVFRVLSRDHRWRALLDQQQSSSHSEFEDERNASQHMMMMTALQRRARSYARAVEPQHQQHQQKHAAHGEPYASPTVADAHHKLSTSSSHNISTRSAVVPSVLFKHQLQFSSVGAGGRHGAATSSSNTSPAVLLSQDMHDFLKRCTAAFAAIRSALCQQCVVKIQALARGVATRRVLLRQLVASVVVQAYARRWLVKRRVTRLRVDRHWSARLQDFARQRRLLVPSNDPTPSQPPPRARRTLDSWKSVCFPVAAAAIARWWRVQHGRAVGKALRRLERVHALQRIGRAMVWRLRLSRALRTRDRLRKQAVRTAAAEATQRAGLLSSEDATRESIDTLRRHMRDVVRAYQHACDWKVAIRTHAFSSVLCLQEQWLLRSRLVADETYQRRAIVDEDDWMRATFEAELQTRRHVLGAALRAAYEKDALFRGALREVQDEVLAFSRVVLPVLIQRLDVCAVDALVATMLEEAAEFERFVGLSTDALRQCASHNVPSQEQPLVPDSNIRAAESTVSVAGAAAVAAARGGPHLEIGPVPPPLDPAGEKATAAASATESAGGSDNPWTDEPPQPPKLEAAVAVAGIPSLAVLSVPLPTPTKAAISDSRGAYLDLGPVPPPPLPQTPPRPATQEQPPSAVERTVTAATTATTTATTTTTTTITIRQNDAVRATVVASPPLSSASPPILRSEVESEMPFNAKSGHALDRPPHELGSVAAADPANSSPSVLVSPGLPLSSISPQPSRRRGAEQERGGSGGSAVDETAMLFLAGLHPSETPAASLQFMHSLNPSPMPLASSHDDTKATTLETPRLSTEGGQPLLLSTPPPPPPPASTVNDRRGSGSASRPAEAGAEASIHATTPLSHATAESGQVPLGSATAVTCAHLAASYAALPDFVLRSLTKQILLLQRAGRGLRDRRWVSLARRAVLVALLIEDEEARERFANLQEPLERAMLQHSMSSFTVPLGREADGRTTQLTLNSDGGRGKPPRRWRSAEQHLVDLHVLFSSSMLMLRMRQQRRDERHRFILATAMLRAFLIRTGQEVKRRRGIPLEFVEIGSVASSLMRSVEREARDAWLDIVVVCYIERLQLHLATLLRQFSHLQHLACDEVRARVSIVGTLEPRERIECLEEAAARYAIEHEENQSRVHRLVEPHTTWCLAAANERLRARAQTLQKAISASCIRAAFARWVRRTLATIRIQSAMRALQSRRLAAAKAQQSSAVRSASSAVVLRALRRWSTHVRAARRKMDLRKEQSRAHAARVLQHWFRQSLARKHEAQRYPSDIVRVQCAVRAFLARRRLAERRELHSKRLAHEAAQRAARLIQLAFRRQQEQRRTMGEVSLASHELGYRSSSVVAAGLGERIDSVAVTTTNDQSVAQPQLHVATPEFSTTVGGAAAPSRLTDAAAVAISDGPQTKANQVTSLSAEAHQQPLMFPARLKGVMQRAGAAALLSNTSTVTPPIELHPPHVPDRRGVPISSGSGSSHLLPASIALPTSAEKTGGGVQVGLEDFHPVRSQHPASSSIAASSSMAFGHLKPPQSVPTLVAAGHPWSQSAPSPGGLAGALVVPSESSLVSGSLRGMPLRATAPPPLQSPSNSLQTAAPGASAAHVGAGPQTSGSHPEVADRNSGGAAVHDESSLPLVEDDGDDDDLYEMLARGAPLHPVPEGAHSAANFFSTTVRGAAVGEGDSTLPLPTPELPTPTPDIDGAGPTHERSSSEVLDGNGGGAAPHVAPRLKPPTTNALHSGGPQVNAAMTVSYNPLQAQHMHDDDDDPYAADWDRIVAHGASTPPVLEGPPLPTAPWRSEARDHHGVAHVESAAGAALPVVAGASSGDQHPPFQGAPPTGAAVMHLPLRRHDLRTGAVSDHFSAPLAPTRAAIITGPRIRSGVNANVLRSTTGTQSSPLTISHYQGPSMTSSAFHKLRQFGPSAAVALDDNSSARKKRHDDSSDFAAAGGGGDGDISNNDDVASLPDSERTVMYSSLTLVNGVSTLNNHPALLDRSQQPQTVAPWMPQRHGDPLAAAAPLGLPPFVRGANAAPSFLRGLPAALRGEEPPQRDSSFPDLDDAVDETCSSVASLETTTAASAAPAANVSVSEIHVAAPLPYRSSYDYYDYSVHHSRGPAPSYAARHQPSASTLQHVSPVGFPYQTVIGPRNELVGREPSGASRAFHQSAHYSPLRVSNSSEHDAAPLAAPLSGSPGSALRWRELDDSVTRKRDSEQRSAANVGADGGDVSVTPWRQPLSRHSPERPLGLEYQGPQSQQSPATPAAALSSFSAYPDITVDPPSSPRPLPQRFIRGPPRASPLRQSELDMQQSALSVPPSHTPSSTVFLSPLRHPDESRRSAESLRRVLHRQLFDDARR